MSIAIAQPFRIDATGAVATTTELYEQVADRIMALINTGRNERVMRPGLGTNINTLVFDNINELTIAQLEEMVRQEISKYEKNVFINSVYVSDRTTPGAIFLDVIYSILEFQQQMTYTATIRVGGEVEEIVSSG